MTNQEKEERERELGLMALDMAERGRAWYRGLEMPRPCVVCASPITDGTSTCSERCWQAMMRVRVRTMLTAFKSSEANGYLNLEEK